jgi:hypothetical protein
MKALCSLYQRETLEANAKFEARQQLRDRFVQLEQRRSDLEAKCSAYAELHGNVKADGNDQIQLNVGGTRIVVKRSVLTLFPDSKLAVLFSGRWDKKLLRDKKNRIFLDVDPVCFKIILDYLTQCLELPGDAPLPSLLEVSEELRRMLDQYCIFFNIKFSEETSTSTQGVYDVVDDDDHDDDDNGREDVIEDSCDTLKAVLKEERNILDSMEQALAEEESSFLGEELFVTSFAGGETKDIVQLNVSGGEVMSVRRSTLPPIRRHCLVPGLQAEAGERGRHRHRE